MSGYFLNMCDLCFHFCMSRTSMFMHALSEDAKMHPLRQRENEFESLSDWSTVPCKNPRILNLCKTNRTRDKNMRIENIQNTENMKEEGTVSNNCKITVSKGSDY